MIKVLNSGKCLGVAGGSVNDAAPIQQFGCDPSKASQRFTLTTDGTYRLRDGTIVSLFKLKTFSGKCTSMHRNSLGGWTGVGSYVEQQPCVSENYQRFYWARQQHPWDGMTIESLSDGSTWSTQYCLQIQNASTADGAGPLLDVCNSVDGGAKNDSFVFMPVNP